MNGKDRIVLPLDFPAFDLAQAMAITLIGHVGVFKIGLEAISAGFAHQLCRFILSLGGKVFWELAFGFGSFLRDRNAG